jgi:probable F420-dependent oxidoreductase
MKVRIGLGLGTRGLRDDACFGPLVDDLERLGFDSLWLSERLTSPTLDPLVGMAYTAGRTRHLKFGTSVLVLPGRNPAVLAKELASLDRISGGRLLLAFGLGAADAAEHQAFGIQPRERAAWFDEALPLLRRLWSEDNVDHHGARFNYQGMSIRPRPIQQPLEVWTGGFGPATLRRTGRLADGWLPSNVTPAEAAAGRKAIEQAAAEAGREIDPEHFGAIVVYARGEAPSWAIEQLRQRRPDLEPAVLLPAGLSGLRERLREYVEVGVSKFVVRPVEEPESWRDELEALAEAVLPLQSGAERLKARATGGAPLRGRDDRGPVAGRDAAG